MTMEKQAKPRNNFLKLLPKAAAAVRFQNPPFSPGRDNIMTKLKPHAAANNKGFSGHSVCLIPHEARIRKEKNESFGAQEPTSPKVSCMGHVKQKKKNIERTVSLPQDRPKPAMLSPRMVKKHASKIKKMFSSKKLGKKSNSVDDGKKPTLVDRAPRLGQMKRFSSGRDAFASFDWTAQVAPEEADHDHHRNSNSEEDSDRGEEEEAETIIPFSAPIIMGGQIALQPRKEVNIWQRRTINPPRPLRII
ncbi:uncharacterized protein At1g76070 [Carica papaya]|uniref:uncharacterized protein At1g76070 n=1 Tax=Carica papaya TaxID=3649 RepID=UPI000B8CA4DF|nr:uncharacterized protein At1g76070 [Carica papaya]